MTKLTIPANTIPNFVTSDERLQEGWHVATNGATHRDADSITESNHDVLCERLSLADPDGEHHDVIRCGHWGVGWVAHVIVDPTDTPVMECLAQAQRELEQYPILDEDHHSQLECDWHEAERCGEGCSLCESYRERERDLRGVWGCGSLGHQHTREACANALKEWVVESPERNTVLLALRDEMTDDAQEEQDAIDMLNESANFQTSAFGWCDGDFGVWEV